MRPVFGVHIKFFYSLSFFMHLLIHGQKRHCDNIAAALQPSPLNGHQNETYDGAKLHQIGAICAPNKNDKNANRERGSTVRIFA